MYLYTFWNIILINKNYNYDLLVVKHKKQKTKKIQKYFNWKKILSMRNDM